MKKKLAVKKETVKSNESAVKNYSECLGISKSRFSQLREIALKIITESKVRSDIPLAIAKRKDLTLIEKLATSAYAEIEILTNDPRFMATATVKMLAGGSR